AMLRMSSSPPSPMREGFFVALRWIALILSLCFPGGGELQANTVQLARYQTFSTEAYWALARHCPIGM
ncbi:MAG: hypothetical protein LC793_04355, partial [Thermomicrobia bacterium]|nr:hypothetical protein [Thermomicrobia bacterium]